MPIPSPSNPLGSHPTPPPLADSIRMAYPYYMALEVPQSFTMQYSLLGVNMELDPDGAITNFTIFDLATSADYARVLGWYPGNGNFGRDWAMSSHDTGAWVGIADYITRPFPRLMQLTATPASVKFTNELGSHSLVGNFYGKASVQIEPLRALVGQLATERWIEIGPVSVTSNGAMVRHLLPLADGSGFWDEVQHKTLKLKIHETIR